MLTGPGYLPQCEPNQKACLRKSVVVHSSPQARKDIAGDDGTLGVRYQDNLAMAAVRDKRFSYQDPTWHQTRMATIAKRGR